MNRILSITLVGLSALAFLHREHSYLPLVNERNEKAIAAAKVEYDAAKARGEDPMPVGDYAPMIPPYEVVYAPDGQAPREITQAYALKLYNRELDAAVEGIDINKIKITVDAVDVSGYDLFESAVRERIMVVNEDETPTPLDEVFLHYLEKRLKRDELIVSVSGVDGKVVGGEPITSAMIVSINFPGMVEYARKNVEDPSSRPSAAKA